MPCAFDHNFRDCGVLQLLLHVSANLKIAVQKRGQLLRRRVPARTPVAIHAESESNRINFLSHKIYFLAALAVFFLPLFSAPFSPPSPVFFSCSRVAFLVSCVSIATSSVKTIRI